LIRNVKVRVGYALERCFILALIYSETSKMFSTHRIATSLIKEEVRSTSGKERKPAKKSDPGVQYKIACAFDRFDNKMVSFYQSAFLKRFRNHIQKRRGSFWTCAVVDSSTTYL